MRNFILIVAFIAGINNSIIAQTPVIDSLRLELVKLKADSIKVHDRIRISWYLFQVPDSAAAWKYILEGDSIADKAKNPVLKGIVYEHMGYLHSRIYSKKAITYYLLAENILKAFPNSLAAKKSMASLGLNIGIEHMNASDLEGSLAYYFDGIRRYESYDSNNRNLPILYASIISTYYNLGKYETALSYCEKSYVKSTTMGNPATVMSSCINYGRVLYKLNQPEKARVYFDRGKAMADSLNDPYFQSKYYQVLGSFKYDEKKYPEALDLFIKALPYIKLTKADFDIAGCYLWLGICNAYINNFKEGRDYLAAAYGIARQSDYTLIRKDVYLNRYLLEKEAGNYALSINYLDSFNLINDSLKLVAQADRIEFTDAKYQAEKKETMIGQLKAEKEIQQLNLQKKNTLNYILLFTALGILLIGLLIYRNIKQKQKLQQQRITELETQQQLTATEAVLKGEEQERTRLAKDLHDGLGGMLSGIKYSLNTMKGNLIMTPENSQAFERSMDMLDSSIKEMRRVAHNMMPEALVKFGLNTALKDLCNDVNQSGALEISYQSMGFENETLDQTTAITVYRIVQELINNIMKHAAAKKAIVQVTKSADQLAITVEDDGHGFDTTLLKHSKGIGWTNIQSRVEFLKGAMDVKSEQFKGTSVHIEIGI